MKSEMAGSIGIPVGCLDCHWKCHSKPMDERKHCLRGELHGKIHVGSADFIPVLRRFYRRGLGGGL